MIQANCLKDIRLRSKNFLWPTGLVSKLQSESFDLTSWNKFRELLRSQPKEAMSLGKEKPEAYLVQNQHATNATCKMIVPFVNAGLFCCNSPTS